MNPEPQLVDDGRTILFHIPIAFKYRGGRKEIILPDDVTDAHTKRPTTQDALVQALARAHHWQELLDTGQVASITEIASRLEVDSSYVGRHLRLTLLAPDIVESILAGKEPSGLSLAKLVRGLPVVWQEQRHKLGFRGA